MRATGDAGRWLILFAIATAQGVGAGRVDEFLGVKNWHGTIEYKGSASGSSSGGGVSDVWQFGIDSKFDINLDTYVGLSQSWTGTFKGNANVNATDKFTLSNCTQTLGSSYMGPVGVDRTFTLNMFGDNQYKFFPSNYVVSGVIGSTDSSCAGKNSSPGTGPWLPGLGTMVLTLPATGFSLKGSMEITMDSPVQPFSLAFGGTPAQVKGTLTWDIEPGAIVPNVVVVQKTPALMNWRPTAGAKGAKGNSVDLVAKLQLKDGTPSPVKAAYFTWELTKCSKEPGYAMNSEVDNSQPFDMKIESGADLLPIDPTGQSAKTKPGETQQSTITIGSYDWGGFATIKVTAYLPDNSTIVGYLEGDESQTNIRLPLRSESSLIADAWKKQHPEIQGLADVTDNESDPVGDGNPGDGFTLYEEYRGFIVNGEHIEGNVKKKDYFILNNAGWLYISGIELFQALSELEVHYRLRKAELSDGRVMNRNHNEGAHNVDQHGIVINAIAANANYAEAIGGPGNPVMISQVVTPKILPSTPQTVDYLGSTLAHELLHACNVFHHGDGPSWKADLLRLPTDVVLVGGAPANVITEDGASAAPLLPVNRTMHVILGRAGDTHTGNDDCVMRYDDSSGYFSSSDGSTVYYTPGEPAGASLCTSAAGTGINDSERTPQARYGDASRGNCLRQILVNDKIPAPRR